MISYYCKADPFEGKPFLVLRHARLLNGERGDDTTLTRRSFRLAFLPSLVRTDGFAPLDGESGGAGSLIALLDRTDPRSSLDCSSNRNGFRHQDLRFFSFSERTDESDGVGGEEVGSGS